MAPMTPLKALQPQHPAGLINPLGQPLPQADELKAQKSPLPKLQMKGGDATVATRTIKEWVGKTVLATAPLPCKSPLWVHLFWEAGVRGKMAGFYTGLGEN